MSQIYRLAILASGGPAPGINSVISAATIRACVSGIEVIGIRDGFRWLMEGDVDHVTPLGIKDVTPIHSQGGSYLGVSRANPASDPRSLETTVTTLLRLNVDKLITIGGDETALAALELARHAGGRIRIVHVPKTIDNDLDLPYGVPTFGYQTARHVGCDIVHSLMVDARAASRWYFVVTMGRKAGHLALGIGKAVGATLTLIPEEYPERTIPFRWLVDTIVGGMIKRLAYGRSDGTVVLAAGLSDRLEDDVRNEIEVTRRDGLRDVRFAEMLQRSVGERLEGLGMPTEIIAKTLGTELAGADPIPFDLEYTRDLGYCATKYLLEGGSEAVITIQNAVFKPLPLDELVDPTTERARVRLVDVNTESYKIARRYMIRLRRDDFEDAHELAKLAATAKLGLDEFRKQFDYLVQDEPPPLRFLGTELRPNGF